MRVGPITPTLPVPWPSEKVDATRLNGRRFGSVCSAPITTVSPGPSRYSFKQAHQPLLLLHHLQQRPQRLERQLGVRRDVFEQRCGTLDEQRVLAGRVGQRAAGELERLRHQAVVQGPVLAAAARPARRAPGAAACP